MTCPICRDSGTQRRFVMVEKRPASEVVPCAYCNREEWAAWVAKQEKERKSK